MSASLPNYDDRPRIPTWLLVVTALLIAFIGLSIQPVRRLKSNPPATFAAQDDAPEVAAYAAQYWRCARTTIQWKYMYGEALPDDPPPEFVNTADAPLPRRSAELRQLYWGRLRRAWLVNDSWDTSLTFQLEWLPRTILKYADKAADFVVQQLKALHT